jgi:hypothetical protein
MKYRENNRQLSKNAEYLSSKGLIKFGDILYTPRELLLILGSLLGRVHGIVHVFKVPKRDAVTRKKPHPCRDEVLRRKSYYRSRYSVYHRLVSTAKDLEGGTLP